MSYEDVPSIGEMVRALRLGFGWYGPCQGFIRISGEDTPFKFEFYPMGLIPNRYKNHIPHRCWWPDVAFPALPLNESPFIRSLKRVKQPFTVYLDDNGELATKTER